MVKNLLANTGDAGSIPGWKEMATHSSILAWEIPWDRRAWRATVHGIHRRTIQKDLHNPDNDDGVITHLEPDILECKVKWALGSVIQTGFDA